MTEIAPCPMPGCGGYCEPLRCGPPSGLGWYIKCFNCGHNSGQRHSVDNAIIDHNALCADVQLARNLRNIFAACPSQEWIGLAGVPRVEAWMTNDGDADHTLTIADTLDAALAELAKKIEEPT